MDLSVQMKQLAQQARVASRQLATLDAAQKNLCLQAMATALEQAAPRIQAENEKDLEFGRAEGLSNAMLDRLQLNEVRIHAMSRGLREVAALPDPVGRLIEERVRPNGLRLQKVSVPLGVIVIIYESRPNVTADAASLCFKSGNAVILRGGKEAIHSNKLIAELMVQAAQAAFPNFPMHAIQVVPTTDRDAIRELLSLTDLVDLCMPRGGEGLIRAVVECSKVPVIKHYKGVCHVYVDAEADLVMASSIVLNAKTQRPAVCNAAETLLVDASIAKTFLPLVAELLAAKNVELRADPKACEILGNGQSGALISSLNLRSVSEQDYFTEYNDSILNVRVVEGVEQAIEHITHYGSSHSDSIVTHNASTAHTFMQRVDSAVVYWNVSTRFTDGAEFGMGAEIGISTDKIGARGPMGLEELTSYKWLGFGNGQIRS